MLASVLAGAAVLFSTLACLAADLKGQVLENEVGGRPMVDVVVDADGANQTHTDKGGKFTLSFPNKKPGHQVRLTIDKPGYVVVNDIQMEFTLLDAPAAKPPLLVLLCQGKGREEMARRYYRLRAISAIEDGYKKQLRRLEKEKATLGEEYRAKCCGEDSRGSRQGADG
jgi:hypothetical protein